MEQSGEDESITVNVRTIEFGNHEIEIPAFVSATLIPQIIHH